MTLAITPLFAAALALMGIGLAMHVSIMRGATGISILHGDNMTLAARMRRHGNFAEHVPMALLLMAFAETLGAPVTILYAQGVALVGARILHAIGLNAEKAAAPLRIMGSVGTTLVSLTSVALIFQHGFMR